MPTIENRTLLLFRVIRTEQFTGNTNGVQSNIVDTHAMVGGVGFTFTGSSDVGTVELNNILVEESDDAGMAGATTVPANSFTNPLISAGADATGTTESLLAAGLIGTKRYLRVTVDVALVGGASVVSAVIIVFAGEETNPERGIDF